MRQPCRLASACQNLLQLDRDSLIEKTLSRTEMMCLDFLWTFQTVESEGKKQYPFDKVNFGDARPFQEYGKARHFTRNRGAGMASLVSRAIRSHRERVLPCDRVVGG